MPYQTAVTIRALVRPGTPADALPDLARQWPSRPSMAAAFDRLQNVHSARVFMIPEAEEPGGRPISASIVYAADVDGPVRRHLHDVGLLCGEFADLIFSPCEGYPEVPDARTRLAWLRRHRVPSNAYYVNTVGRGAQQIRDETLLREALEDIIDQRRGNLECLSAAQIHRILRDEVRGRTDLVFSVHKARQLPPLRRYGERIRLAVLLLLLVLFSPVVLITVIAGLLAIRRREMQEWVSTERPDAEAVRALRAHEDRAAANPFAAVGVVKAGRLRRTSTAASVWAIDAAARHVYKRGSLTGVKTIHFARWIFLDDHRRMAFLSVYDGSLESYMDDFIDKVAFGLNAVFSNGVGYPRTRFLVLDGARDEQAFKNYLRRHQQAVSLAYSAYPQLTATNIENNARIREGLTRELSDEEARSWLALL